MSKTVAALPDETTSKGRKTKSKALATMADLENLYAARSQEAAAAAPASEGAPRVVPKDMMFWVGEKTLPDPLEVIVVAEALQHVWYEEAYDPENPVPPSCFAVGAVSADDPEGRKTLHAYPTSPNIQGGANDHDCGTCPLNQFGSAEVGRGKACANNRVLAIVMADDPALTDPKRELRYATMTLSPTALSAWGKFVKGIDREYKRPPEGIVTKFSFNKTDADERRRKAVVPIGYDLIRDYQTATRVNKLREEILESGVLVRPLPIETRTPAAAPAKSKGVKGVKGVKAVPGAAKKAKF